MEWLNKKDVFISIFKPDNKPLTFNEISAKLNSTIGDDNEINKLRDELIFEQYLLHDHLNNRYKLSPKCNDFVGFVKQKETQDKLNKRADNSYSLTLWNTIFVILAFIGTCISIYLTMYPNSKH
jgi:hypothetical protein